MSKPKKSTITEWFYFLHNPPTRKASNCGSSPLMWFTLNKLRHIISHHQIEKCYQLLPVVARMKYLEPNILVRLIFLLIESCPPESVNCNVLAHLENLLRKLDISVPDMFTEMLGYLLKCDRIDVAKEMLNERLRYMSYRTHRFIPTVRIKVAYYSFYIKFLEWRKDITSKHTQSKDCDVSVTGTMINFITSIKETTGNHEYFIICLLEMLYYYKFNRKAYKVAKDFQKNNPLNLSANKIFLSIISQYPHDNLNVDIKENDQNTINSISNMNTPEMNDRNSDDEDDFGRGEECFRPSVECLDRDKRSIISHLRLIDPTGNELLELSSKESLVSQFVDLMNSLEFIDAMSSRNKWKRLNLLIDNIIESNDEDTTRSVSEHWNCHYKTYWMSIDLDRLSSIHHKILKRQKLIQTTIAKLNNDLQIYMH